ncbi:transcription initiation factor TFIID subunit 7, putative [Plasmodium vivax]|nr:transcription initiation factor TFIID subunit 7, putative [Plasmodium vivax]
MEPKRERSSIKISLNLSANKRDDKSVSECNTGGDGDSRIKSKSKEVSQALGLIEDIRSGTFNYKDLQEIYFMNDVDLEKMIIDAKGAEEGNPEREAQDAGHSPYGGETMYGGETLYRGEDAHGESAIRSKEFTQGKLLQSGGANLHSPMHSNERSLTNENEEDNGASGRNVYVLNNQVGKVCIIRFPPEVSKEIKKNLLKKNLHLEIEPTSLLNSRLFIIHFRNINKKFWGILLELSTHIEVHKTLDRNNLYKTNDVSQMIYVVQNFHFENYAKLFKYHDIYFAEKFLHDYLNAKYYDYYDMYVKTYTEMHTHLRIGRESHKKQNEIVDERTDISEIINSLDNTYSIMRELEKETGGDISLETLLNYEITNENYESDVSDLLMGGSHYLRKRA